MRSNNRSQLQQKNIIATESNYSTALVCEMAGVMDLESLRAELVEKEKNLVLAALAGKDLLEENKKLRQELNALKEDEAALEEVLILSLSISQKIKNAMELEFSYHSLSLLLGTENKVPG